MKDYKVGDTIYVKGKITDVDHNETMLPYCVVSSPNYHFWASQESVLDELPTSEPVKPVLPEKVVLTKKQAEIIERAHGHVMPACYISKQPDDEELLMNAYVNGYTVAEEKKYNIKVPHVSLYYWKKPDGGLGIDDLNVATADDDTDDFEFTESEIENYGLQDCEKEEVTDDEQ